MEPNALIGLSVAFEYALKFDRAEHVTLLAMRLTASHMGHPGQHRYLPEAYHETVSKAQRWLREASKVIAGELPRSHDAALEERMQVRRADSIRRAVFNHLGEL